MDSTTKSKVKATVIQILQTSDMQEMTEYKVRNLAAEKLSIDLSEPSRKMFVREVVNTFLKEYQQQQQNDNIVDDGSVAAEDEEGEEENDDGKMQEFDDNGDLIICQLSEKRRVTLQDFKGKTLVSIREYYKKDGKFLPTTKGISLTAEQWSSFKKNVTAIENAIEEMEARLS